MANKGNWIIVIGSSVATGIIAFAAGLAVARHSPVSTLPPPSNAAPDGLMSNDMMAIDDSDAAIMNGLADDAANSPAAKAMNDAADQMNAGKPALHSPDEATLISNSDTKRETGKKASSRDYGNELSSIGI